MLALVAKNRGKLLLAAAGAAYTGLGVFTGDMDFVTAATKFASMIAALGLF